MPKITGLTMDIERDDKMRPDGTPLVVGFEYDAKEGNATLFLSPSVKAREIPGLLRKAADRLEKLVEGGS